MLESALQGSRAESSSGCFAGLGCHFGGLEGGGCSQKTLASAPAMVSVFVSLGLSAAWGGGGGLGGGGEGGEGHGPDLHTTTCNNKSSERRARETLSTRVLALFRHTQKVLVLMGARHREAHLLEGLRRGLGSSFLLTHLATHFSFLHMWFSSHILSPEGLPSDEDEGIQTAGEVHLGKKRREGLGKVPGLHFTWIPALKR